MSGAGLPKAGGAAVSLTMHELASHVGRELGVTDWLVCDQSRIQAFADCTEDRQWIHVDVARAREQSPFGGPVAHGMLTLSLLPHWVFALPAVPADAGAVLNYGFDKVRFLAPVAAGSRVRSRIRLASVTAKDGGRILMTQEHTVEIEGAGKPALIAELLLMVLPRS